MTETIRYTIFHLEDEANNWRALPRALRNALFELLKEDVRRTLVYAPPADRTAYPSMYSISWQRDGGTRVEVRYWLLESDTIADVGKEIGSGSAFIIDVMRPDREGILKSSLAASISSITPHVVNWEEQVRIFSAFGIPEAEVDKARPLRLIKKSEPDLVVKFVLERLGEIPRQS